jgi:hypothetical protein
MPTTRSQPVALDAAVAPVVTPEDLLALVTTDEELLKAEFDAIIADSWGGPAPPRGPTRPGAFDGAEQPRASRAIVTGCPAAVAAAGAAGPRGWHSERGPPGWNGRHDSAASAPCKPTT